MTLKDVIQVLFLVLVIGGPVFQAISKKMKEAKLKRQREIAVRKQQEELLRTGRTSHGEVSAPARSIGPAAPNRPLSEADALRRLQELARQRQAQLQQQQQRAAPRQGPVTPSRSPARPASPGRGQQGPVRPSAPQTPQRSRQQRSAQVQANERQRQVQQESSSARSVRPAEASESVERSRPAHTPAQLTADEIRQAETAAAIAPAAVLTGAALLGLTAARARNERGPIDRSAESRLITDLRRAIVLREVLDKPVCLRDPDEQRAW